MHFLSLKFSFDRMSIKSMHFPTHNFQVRLRYDNSSIQIEITLGHIVSIKTGIRSLITHIPKVGLSSRADR